MRKICVKLSLYLIYILCAMVIGANAVSAVAYSFEYLTEPPTASATMARLQGVVTNESGIPVPYATVYVDGTSHGVTTDAEGRYMIYVDAGDATIVASSLGYESDNREMTFYAGNTYHMDYTLRESATDIEEVMVSASGVGVVKRSPFNAVAIDTKALANGSKSLSDALTKAPGVKLRESGGVGSDMAISLDGFSGKHVKVFIDGVPQEGVGGSFSLNNIPAGYAERIEIYRGVVPVGFGADALGGVVNIVTAKRRSSWFADASYSYGSFNTHRSTINAGQRLHNGFMWEINAFQNYSDNDYEVMAPVEDFETGRIDKSTKYRVRRFNDTFHNEAIVAKLGVVDKRWADRLVVGVTYSQMYKEIQTGVRQDIVYGDKHRRGSSLMPSLEYRKRNLITEGLDLTLTANYNHNTTYNIDTSRYKYNWLGDKHRLNSPGEQSYQHTRSSNNNWNATATLTYRLGEKHAFTFNHVFNAFTRSNTSLLAEQPQEDAIAKRTYKNISGLQYRITPNERWSASLFAKYYNQGVRGPMAVDDNASAFVEVKRKESALGYGAAATYLPIEGLQAKLSYEKAYRLPTIEEMFGDEDLEMGDIGIRPENSDNINVSLSYSASYGDNLQHGIYVEGGFVWRDTKDYIQRNIVDMSGGKAAATYINYGRVRTLGGNITARYTFSKWLSVGGNITYMDVRDNMPTAIGSSKPNLGYGDRMPNIPYLFADSDITFTWHDCIWRGNTLTISYDNSYLKGFYYYSARVGTNKSEYMVPSQFSHNISIGYSIKEGRYNISAECRNLTNEALYDNFSLQKAGRAFYIKLRVAFGGN